MPNRPLPLILAREFASNVATPFLVLDAEGTLVFFNERAEQIIGSTWAEFGELPEHEWRSRLQVERLDGTPVANEETPSAVARRERRPIAGDARLQHSRRPTADADGDGNADSRT